ncbi:hypothetical protein KIN20_002181 [Parelaphostrongylus tenuis]|uniref:tRNA pseudouridine synthase n=1 Tax=Parelaphostrongylus tenuis TaxID=148309 RepID=A0AAD5MDU8_PARTN|nr:hypothetical protein KIN20_002181 [Parelaphostrongylus tenuis]
MIHASELLAFKVLQRPEKVIVRRQQIRTEFGYLRLCQFADMPSRVVLKQYEMVFPLKPGSQKRPRVNDLVNPADTMKDRVTEEHLPSEEPTVKRRRCIDFEAHPRRRIAIKFLYYGWEFDGLVQQTNTENTVEKRLMNALLKTKLIPDEKSCDISRCGRTDKGVSAFKQVAALIVRSADKSGKFVFWHDSADKSVIENYAEKEELPYLKMINSVLPRSIRVIAWAAVPRDFSARHTCNMRVYKYSLPRANLNLEVMQQACKLLVGTHDFRNFCQVGMSEKRVNMSFVREIFDVSLEPISPNESSSDSSRNDLIELTIQGSGFLYHMVRYIVTVLHEIGQGNEKPELISDLLDVIKTPCRPHYTFAAATPLCLYECRFDSANLEWIYDDFILRRTISSLQGTLADLHTRTRIVENMLNGLIETPMLSELDLDTGLLEFTQDRPMPPRYFKFAERMKCDSIEEKREKLDRKKEGNGDKAVV